MRRLLQAWTAIRGALDTGHSPCSTSEIALAGEQRCLGTAGPQREAESRRNVLAHFKSEGLNSLKEKHLRTTPRRYTFGIGAQKGKTGAYWHTDIQQRDVRAEVS